MISQCRPFRLSISQRVTTSSAFHLRGILNVGLFVGWFDLGVHVRTATPSAWHLIRRAMDSVGEQGALPVRGVARGVNGDQGDRLRLVSWGSAHRVPIVRSRSPQSRRCLAHRYAGFAFSLASPAPKVGHLPSALNSTQAAQDSSHRNTQNTLFHYLMSRPA